MAQRQWREKFEFPSAALYKINAEERKEGKDRKVKQEEKRKNKGRKDEEEGVQGGQVEACKRGSADRKKRGSGESNWTFKERRSTHQKKRTTCLQQSVMSTR